MPVFRVAIQGKNFWIRQMERRWFGLWRYEYAVCVGFFTTRFVEADSAEEASDKVRKVVLEDIRGLMVNRTDEPWSCKIVDIEEMDGGFHMSSPGGGFCFYTNDDLEAEEKAWEIERGSFST